MRSCYHSLLLMPAKNVQFLPSETSKFFIETSVCPVVTKSSKTMMLRSGGMLLALKTVPTRCFEGAKALALSHSPFHDEALDLTSPPPDFLFSSIHPKPTKPTIPPQKKEHSLLVLPSVHTILNFATEFFEMFTKLQSEHPQIVFQVFQVFRVFQVFHFAFGPQNSPVLVQIRTNPANRPNRPTAISWLRKTPKKAIHHWSTNTILPCL